MKKNISFLLCVSLLFLSIQINVQANDNIEANEFFSQVKELANTYDNGDGLASEDSDSLYTYRLIVKTETNEPLDNYYGAVAVVEGYDCLHFLQYQNTTQAENAYISFSFDDVVYVEYDFYITLSEEAESNIAFVSNNHLSWNSSATQVDEALDFISKHGNEYSEIRVAVIDSGIYAAHDFFDNSLNQRIIDSNHIYTVKYTSKTDGSSYTIDYSSMEDDLYHGTHVSGIIYDNTPEKIKILPYRVTDQRSILYSDILAAFESILIKNGIVTPKDISLVNNDPSDDIDIVNMSFEGSLERLDTSGKTLFDKITLAVKNGMIIVAAAGNFAKNTNVVFPACHPGVITVSATDENNIPADFSNFGKSVDIAAPGVNINSTTPRTFYDNNDNGVFEAYSTYMSLNGTSMAAPLVAAAAATLKSISPDMSAAEIQRIIKETAYVPEGWDTKYGTGIVNFYNMVKQDVSGTPTVKLNSDGKIEITAPEGTDSRLYYTLDGSTPTIDNHLVYTEPFSISGKNVNVITAVCHENGKLIGEAVKYRTKSFQTLKLDYKETVKPINTEAKWYSWNSEVASVDRDGNITGTGVGETTVTAILDSGRRINYNVQVEYTSWQWFIRIFLLGFLWY